MIFEYNGYEVGLNTHHQFHVAKLEMSFDTAQQAKDAIDSRIKYEAKVKKKNLELEVIDTEGTKHILTGIHQSQNKFLLKPPYERHNSPTIFPAVPWIVAALEEKAKHQAEIDRIDNHLEPYELEEVRDWNSSYRGKDVSEKYDILEKDYAEKKAAAEKGDPA